MIVIIDYGMGNLRSAQKGLEKAGHAATISDEPRALAGAHGIVLPGVGAFKDCFDGLRDAGFVGPLREAVAGETPLLGICVGMQLLFERSEEGLGSEGLGFLAGKVVRFPDPKETGLKVPHMGWNQVKPVPMRPNPLFPDPNVRPYMYFVHSFYPVPDDSRHILATTDYGVEFPSVVGSGRVFGTQFHPEKSQRDGIGLLRAFGEYVKEASGRATLAP